MKATEYNHYRQAFSQKETLCPIKVKPVFFMLVFFIIGTFHASGKGFVVDSLTTVVDGLYLPYSQLQPGDSIFLKGGLRQNLLLRNLNGSAEKPLIIINQGGVVVFNTDNYYGISIRNSRYFRLTGQGYANEFYGIHIERVVNGAGIGINDLCSDFEVDHIFIENTLLGGLYAKTDPDCTSPSTRDQFTQYKTIIHDNHISNVGNEGMYIGSTKYFGLETNCNGRDTLLMPPVLEGVHIYNNIIENTAWDGIQVSSATKDCSIWGNMILYDSQEGYFSQMAGILLGGGSKCDCYNNYISQGKGNGIESHGLGGYRIFNNIIVDAGRTYLPLDSTERKHGIYVSDISVEKDSSFSILFNDIIRPKSDGIRFQSTISKNSIIASNLIVDPGSYDYYENSNTSYKGDDAYIMIPDPSSTEVTQLNNYKTRNINNARVSLTDFKPMVDSPLIDAGSSNHWGVTFDYLNATRPNGPKADIGAYEFDQNLDGTDSTDKDIALKAYPNPVRTLLSIRFNSELPVDVSLMVYDISGKIVLQKNQKYQSDSDREINIPVNMLPTGIYLYSIQTGGYVKSGKFIKIS